MGNAFKSGNKKHHYLNNPEYEDQSWLWSVDDGWVNYTFWHVMLGERIPLVTVFDLILLLENLESVKVCWHVIIWQKLLLLSTFSIILIFLNKTFLEWVRILSHWTVIESGSFYQLHLNWCLPMLSPEDGHRSSFYTFWVLLYIWDGRQVDKCSNLLVWTGYSFVFGFLFLNCIHCSFISSGEVLGRRKMKVRICSCPKRDKDKEEADAAKNQNQTLSGGKRKLASTLERQNKQVAKRKFEGFPQVKY